mmetsp:Transcript_9262/g.26596  ORF Transcript_9262/g.26596 Transcript_9262/m.26596 type:complete len:347 (-) Transcript_9262:564-1604(-)
MGLQQRTLIAAWHVEGNAIERRVALNRQPPTLRALRIASPALVAVLGVGLGAALLLATRPELVLLEALCVHLLATLRVGAVFAQACTPGTHPIADHFAFLGGFVRALRRAHAHLRALPRRPAFELGLALFAARPALAPELVHHIALVPGVGAALRFGAVCARPRTLLRHPRGGAHRLRPQGLATPRQPVRRRQVRTWLAAQLALGKGLVLAEALVPGGLATLCGRAVLLTPSADLRRPGSAISERLALPRHRRDLVLRVRPGLARLQALRPVVVLREAPGAGLLATLRLQAALSCSGALVVLARLLDLLCLLLFIAIRMLDDAVLLGSSGSSIRNARLGGRRLSEA